MKVEIGWLMVMGRWCGSGVVGIVVCIPIFMLRLFSGGS